MLDHFVKGRLLVRHYACCMDVFVILGPDKPGVWTFLAEIRDFLARPPEAGACPASRAERGGWLDRASRAPATFFALDTRAGLSI
jgi:hypothetical protein